VVEEDFEVGEPVQVVSGKHAKTYDGMSPRVVKVTGKMLKVHSPEVGENLVGKQSVQRSPRAIPRPPLSSSSPRSTARAALESSPRQSPAGVHGSSEAAEADEARPSLQEFKRLQRRVRVLEQQIQKLYILNDASDSGHGGSMCQTCERNPVDDQFGAQCYSCWKDD
jgi:hypothetical protein